MLEYNREYLQSLNHFLKQVDDRTYIYINEINWEDASTSYYKNAMLIKRKFNQALKIEAFPIRKLRIYLKAYAMLVNIAEECRGESIEDYDIDDDDFIDMFKPPTKKIKN